MNECPQLLFSPIENNGDLWNVFVNISNQYLKCSKKVESLQTLIKEYNK